MKLNFDELKQERIKTYYTLSIDLTTARNLERFDLSGNFIFVYEEYDCGSTFFDVAIVFNESTNDPIPLFKGRRIKTPFYRFFISNMARAAASIKLLVGVDSLNFDALDFLAQDRIRISTVGIIYNLVLTTASTEYSQALPGLTKKFTIRARGGDVKWCFTPGGSATLFSTLKDGEKYQEDLLRLGTVIYAQSTTDLAVLEIIAYY